MKDEKHVKIAMVGAGFAANIHAENYEQLPGIDAEIVAIAVAPKDIAQAKEFCAEYHLDPKNIYDNADKMIAEVEADIVDLVVPTFLHVPFAIKAAKAGKNIICEKPLTGYFGDPAVPIDQRKNVGATDKKTMLQECLKDCERLEKTIKETGVTFCYAENWVYARPVWKAKQLVKAAGGKILEIRCGESHSGSHSPFAAEWKYTGGGALVRMGAHPWGAAIHLKLWEGMRRDGKPIYPESVVATTAKYRIFLDKLPRDLDRIKSRPVDVEDWSTGIITFEDGTNAIVIASDTTLGGIENWINIYTSNCRVEGKISNNDSVMAYAPTDKEFANEYTIEKTETKCGWTPAQASEDWMTGYPFELEDFVTAVVDKRQPDSNLDLAIWTTKAMYAAYLSAQEGKRVTIPKGYKV
nr:Gfo/Idh/MocA family oxidoreductase [Candidatus Sigynarchaeota archaeon]